MKKLFLFSVAFTALTSVAHAATYTACSTTTNYTLSALNALSNGGCELGDKIFSNFGGTIDSAAGTTNLVISFTGSGLGPYNVNISDSTNASLASNFTFTYNVAVDPADPLNYITAVGVGVQDNFGASATNSDTIAACSPNPIVATGKGNTGSATTNCTTNVQSLSVSESYQYLGGTNTVAGIGTAFFQTTETGTPEPVSMVLFGSGLLAVSLIGRKKLVRK